MSVCHCLECKRRTGSAFSAQARFLEENVKVIGEFRTFTRTADSERSLTYRFCPSCGSTVVYQIDVLPDFIAIPLGAFGDEQFPAPAYSNYERRKRLWVGITGDGVVHLN
jgi:hypothetical protein